MAMLKTKGETSLSIKLTTKKNKAIMGISTKGKSNGEGKKLVMLVKLPSENPLRKQSHVETASPTLPKTYIKNHLSIIKSP
jgi:hypothetical protein